MYSDLFSRLRQGKQAVLEAQVRDDDLDQRELK